MVKRTKDHSYVTQTGITLIALIITIIILLILAGVTIKLTMGENGIFNLAKKAKEQTQIVDIKEKIQLAYASARVRAVNDSNIDIYFEEELTKQLGKKGEAYELEKLENNYIVTDLKTGIRYIIDAYGNCTQDETIKDYILKWNVGYNAQSPYSASSSVVAYLVKNETNSDEYTIIFKGNGEICSSYNWKIGNSNNWSQANEIKEYIPKLTKVIYSEGITILPDRAMDGPLYSISNIEFGSTVIIKNRNDVSGAWLTEKRKENPLVIVNDCLVDGENCSGDITIPENIKIICGNAFSNSKVTSIKMGSNVVEIGNSAFNSSKNLKTVEFSQSIKEIKDNAFSGCTSLENIVLQEGLETIGSYAFSGTTGLTCSKIIIPSTVNQIAENAFLNARKSR